MVLQYLIFFIAPLLHPLRAFVLCSLALLARILTFHIWALLTRKGVPVLLGDIVPIDHETGQGGTEDRRERGDLETAWQDGEEHAEWPSFRGDEGHHCN